MCGQGWDGEVVNQVGKIEGASSASRKQRSGCRTWKVTGWGPVRISPPFYFNALEDAVPIFLPSSQCLLAVKRLGSGMVQKLASDK